MALTDTALRHAKPRAKDYTLPGYDGLALFVDTKGAKRWYFRFSWADKQPRIFLGTYPEIGLRDARALRDVARALISRCIDPRTHRRL
ncbi:Arm DNA-binding domain-containing protein [Pseudomonas sp. UMAB-08]|uniref:Arm DNA-binding domain-containing protein n=1 Tax=Pseudomonas sp. UMAB-08 TaxID=1365375 RepID=UPI001C587DEC|nr:Arm DNA-binding domain-containing protein [Pseudomonas sp. UMAB-08]